MRVNAPLVHSKPRRIHQLDFGEIKEITIYTQPINAAEIEAVRDYITFVKESKI